MTRWFGLFAACTFLVACGHGAEWSSSRVAPGYQPGKQLNVAIVVNTTAGKDLKEAIEALTTTLHDELKSKGIDANMLSSAGAPPGAELSVTGWNPGNRAGRYFGSGEGHMTVLVDMKRADGVSTLHGQVRGYVKSGWFGGSSMDAPRAAAKSIANAITSGKFD